MSNASRDDCPRLIPQDLRMDYSRGTLSESGVLADPIAQFRHWFDEARSAGIAEVNAMTLATANPSGAPSARVVLLKDLDARGFSFFTNYDSRKGREIALNPRASLCFYWQPLERQVRIEGNVEKTSREESEAYFRTRPLEAQIGAWVSRQSEVIESRQELERRQAEVAARFAGAPVPLPDFWGGYRVVPETVEFWQGRPGRLHDRLRYERLAAGGWVIRRLSP
jgi:pyridoxamine 5'-phosphate oxidase